MSNQKTLKYETSFGIQNCELGIKIQLEETKVLSLKIKDLN